MDAVHEGVLDAGHHVTVYWYGKNKAASLFGTGPYWGWNAAEGLAWIHQGGGKELYNELINDVLGLNVVGFFAMPMPTQPLGWFKNKIEGPRGPGGPEVPHRRPRRRPVPEDGPGGRPAARRRDPAGHGARRDRRLRVQQPDLGQPLRRPGRRQELHAGQLPSGHRVLRDHLQQGQVQLAARRAPGDPRIRRRGRLDRQSGDRPRQLLERSGQAPGPSTASASGARRSRSWMPSSRPGTSCCPT